MRKTSAKKRRITPDSVYNSEMVTKFVNNLMLDGKKSVAFRIFYDAMSIISEKMEEDGFEVFQQAIKNAMPMVEVRSRRIGGATFQIPSEIRYSRKLSLGMKWLIGIARKRGERTMAQRLAAELMAAYKNEGASIKKKEDTHRMAEANKAFSHFRF